VPALVPLFPATANLAGEVFVTLADPARVPLPGVEPRVLRPGVARYAGHRLACMLLNLPSAELVSPARATVRRVLYSGSGDRPRGGRAGLGSPDEVGMVPKRGGFLDHTQDPPALPPWLTEADVDFFAGEFARTGFRGGLNWYRNIDRNWELMAPYAGAQVTVPALYVAGDRDLVVAFRGMDQLIPNLAKFVPSLRRTLMLPGCGHWTQQERAPEVSAAMIDFLRSL